MNLHNTGRIRLYCMLMKQTINGPVAKCMEGEDDGPTHRWQPAIQWIFFARYWQQQKAAERYLKRLDYYLSALEELQEAYNVQNRLREGVRAMGKAYIESLGPERDSALANVR